MNNETPDGEIVGGTEYWFRAKTYGWGWFPSTWQGWVVTLLYVGLVTYSVFTLKFTAEISAMTAFRVVSARILAPTLLLFFICWKKGEPPHWNWGHEKIKDS